MQQLVPYGLWVFDLFIDFIFTIFTNNVRNYLGRGSSNQINSDEKHPMFIKDLKVKKICSFLYVIPEACTILRYQ